MELQAFNCTERWNVEARGFSAGTNPLKFNFPILMIQLVFIFAISRTLHFSLKRFSQPIYICNIMAGLILGPSVLGRNEKFRETFFPEGETAILHLVARFGLTYYLFIICVKFELPMILKTSSKKILSIGISGTILPGIISAILYNFLDTALKSHYKRDIISVFTLLMPVTSFPNIAHYLDSFNLLTSEVGHLATSGAVISDGMRIIMVVILFVYLEVKRAGYITTIALALAILFVIIFILRPVPKWIIKHTPEGKPVKEIYVTGIMVGALIMGALAHLTLGAALVGVCCFGLCIPAGPPLGSALVNKIDLLVMELLLPVMYVVVGLNIEVDSLQNIKIISVYGVFFIGSIIGKFVGTLIPAMLIMKMSYRNAITLSLIMNVKGVIEAISFLHYKTNVKSMEVQQYTLLVLLTTSLTAILTPVITSIYKPGERLHGSLDKHSMRTIHAANQAIGELRIILCIYEEETVGNVISLLEASNSTILHPISACVVHLVELEGRDAPIIVPYHHKDLTGKSSKSDQIMNAFSKYSTYSSPKLTIQPFTLVAPVKYMQECIHRLAEDQNIPLIIMPINKFQKDVNHNGDMNPLDNLRFSVQENAPCTVGILVNIGLNDPMRYTRFSYKVGVIFIGGADDREALAYAIRMSEHPGVSIMVMRLFFYQEDNETFDKVERRTDDYMVNEYKERKVGNMRAGYCEEVVNDFVHAIRLIKALENEYDLVMVGRRRCTHRRLDKEMSKWSENPELGVIGDVLVTYKGTEGMASVLVLQRHN